MINDLWQDVYVMNYTRDYTEIIKMGEQEFVCRAIRPDDGKRLTDALKFLSPESIKNRFLSNKKGFSDKELVLLTDVNFEDHVALALGEVIDSEIMPVGSARFVIEKDRCRAEFAVTILDHYHSQGLGSLILKKLIEAAREREVIELYGITSVNNDKIINLMRKFGHVEMKPTSPGFEEITIKI